MANLESIQSKLRQKNSVIQTELDTSQGQVENLNMTMSKLGEHIQGVNLSVGVNSLPNPKRSIATSWKQTCMS